MQKENTEYWRRRKTGKRRRSKVKIRFVLFISILFCGLGVFWDCIFGFVVKMRDKKPEFNGENGITSMPPSFFFFLASA